MQTATGTLNTAIQSRERKAVATVQQDPLRDGTYSYDPGVFSDVFSDTFESAGDMGDLTPFIESVSVDRSIATELPDEAKLDTGFGAAVCTVVLAGEKTFGGLPLSQVFTAYNNPLTTLAPRIGTPIRVNLGMRTSAGVETLRQVTGSIRDVAIDPDSGAVTLSVMDRRDDLRTPVSFPVLVADDFNLLRPGLNAQWLMDVIARANGFYASPPRRAQCFLCATLHGSAWPEVGTLVSAKVASAAGAPPQGPVLYGAHANGLLGLVSPSSSNNSVLQYTIAAGLNTNTGSTIYVEMMVDPTTPGGFAVVFIGDPFPGISWEVQVQASGGGGGGSGAGQAAVFVTRNGVMSAAAVVSLPTLGSAGDHIVGVQVTMTATGFTVNARCEGSTGSATGTVANPTGSPSLTEVSITETAGCVVSAVQVTSEPFTAGMFNNGFVASAAYEPSFNYLTATPAVDTSDPWDLLQQLAAAEQGIVLFDENGLLRFYNSRHMTGAGAEVATITTDPAVSNVNLKSLASDETGDSVRNYITVPATPQVLDPAGTAIWELTELIVVPALGAITIFAEFPGPVFLISGVSQTGAKAADGTAGDVSNLFVISSRITATTFNFTISNPNAFDVFVVGNSTTPLIQGDPNLVVLGRCIRPTENGYTAIVQDTGSASRFGTQTFDAPANTFRQSTTSADGLAATLIAALGEPHPTLSGVEIVGDPRLQLADRVRVEEKDGLALDADFWLIGTVLRFSKPDGLAQSVSLRQA